MKYMTANSNHIKTAFAHSLEVENRRIAPRFQLNLPMVHEGTPTTSINISMTGIRYLSPRRENVGSQARLKVYFGKERINLVTKTVWSESFGASSVVGATFTPGSDLEGLARLLHG